MAGGTELRVKINEISDKLDESIAILSESRTHVTELRTDFGNLRKLFEQSTSESIKDSDKVQLTSVQIRKFFFSLAQMMYPFLYCFYRASQENLDNDERFEKYWRKPTASIIGESDEVNKFLQGTYLICRNFLLSLGLMNENGKELSINSEFAQLMKDEVENGGLITDANARQLLEAIKSVT